MKASQLEFEIQIFHQIKLMIEQLAKLARNSNSNLLPPSIESRRYTMELWYTQCGQSRDLVQFCNSIPPQDQYFQPYVLWHKNQTFEEYYLKQ